MTKEERQFNWMRKVKHLCSELKYGCTSCPYYTNGEKAFNKCKIKNMLYSMERAGYPSEWNVEKMEKEFGE